LCPRRLTFYQTNNSYLPSCTQVGAEEDWGPNFDKRVINGVGDWRTCPKETGGGKAKQIEAMVSLLVDTEAFTTHFAQKPKESRPSAHIMENRLAELMEYAKKMHRPASASSPFVCA